MSPRLAHLEAQPGNSSVAVKLLPLMGIVFVGFLIIGLALPVLPIYVHDQLGLGTIAVGLVAGSQFAASLLSRFWAGNYADRRGSKPTVLLGLAAATVAGCLYLASLLLVSTPGLSASILAIGRGVLGGAESFIITGALSWGFGTVGQQNAGKVIAWAGTAVFGAYAVGAPVGTALFSEYGFGSIAVVTTLAPLLAIAIVVPIRPVATIPREHGSLRAVLYAVWLPGVGAALSSVGFGAVITFAVLLFAERGWESGWLAVSCFAGSLMLARILFGHLADSIGGANLALCSLPVEALGQMLMWLAPYPAVALAGAAVTGFGYSLVFPGFGVEVVKRAPIENRALAMGAYTACLDLAMGVSSPLLGAVAAHGGVGMVFAVSGVLVLLASVAAMKLRYRQPTMSGEHM